MEPKDLYRGPNPSIQTMKWGKMVDQQVGGGTSSQGYPLPVDPSSKCAFDHFAKSQASIDVSLPGTAGWVSVEELGSKLLEDSDIGMKMGVAGQGNVKQICGVVGSVKPRVRLPVMTHGEINPVVITQLQDELEDAKQAYEKLRATSVPSKDEIILPKRISLKQLMEMFPAVREQIVAKMGQKLGDAHEEYEIKLKKLQDEHNEEVWRMGAIANETKSKLNKAEEKLRGLATSGQRYPNELFRNVLPGIQNSHGPPRNTANGRQDLHPPGQSVKNQAPQARAFGSPTPLTNRFRKNKRAKGNGKKRGYDKSTQPELGRDVKRVKREQF
ncbi:hypothetical protein EAE96_009339 [Botrytis aclada]|nr:hypothetical protein EAE96_009339 [Botrytis aclada]